jgi:hypothetical protein
MTKAEWVTDFKLEEPDGGQPITCTALLYGIEKHCKTLLEGEHFYDCSAWSADKNRRLPARWRCLIAFAVDGDSEGYYVHIGVMVSYSDGEFGPGQYLDCGFVKMWTAKAAQLLATEAQRFLSAARWN